MERTVVNKINAYNSNNKAEQGKQYRPVIETLEQIHPILSMHSQLFYQKHVSVLCLESSEVIFP